MGDRQKMKAEEQIEVYGARVHNLKNIDVNIPRNSLTVITGLLQHTHGICSEVWSAQM